MLRKKETERCARVYSYALISFIALMLVLPEIVSADEASSPSIVSAFNSFVTGTVQVIEPVAKLLVGDINGKPEYLFLKTLLLLIIFAIIWAVLQSIDLFAEYTWVVVLISGSVSLIAVRFLAQPQWLETILLPSNALGVVLTAFLPLLIYFYFCERVLGSYRVLRKIAWIFAAVTFFAMFFTRYEEIEKLSPNNFNPAYIYVIAGVVSFGLLIFDGTIRRAFVDSEMRALGAADRTALIAELRRKINQANSDHAAGIITSVEHKKMVREFRKRLIAAESY